MIWRTHDAKTVNAILHDPWIAGRINADGRCNSYVEHPLVSFYATDGGVFVAIRHVPEDVEVHVALLPYLLRQATSLAREFLDLCFADEQVMRVSAPILSTLPTTVNWCRKLGFVLEGRKRDACRVGGIPTDVVMMGLTRQEWLRARSEHCKHRPTA